MPETLGTGSVKLHPVQGGYEKMPEDHEVLTAEEAAALLRVSTKTVLALARAGSLPGEKVGRAWRFVRSDVLAYVRGSLPQTGTEQDD
jgi:excisionase family DNA binding protein